MSCLNKSCLPSAGVYSWSFLFCCKRREHKKVQQGGKKLICALRNFTKVFLSVVMCLSKTTLVVTSPGHFDFRWWQRQSARSKTTINTSPIYTCQAEKKGSSHCAYSAGSPGVLWVIEFNWALSLSLFVPWKTTFPSLRRFSTWLSVVCKQTKLLTQRKLRTRRHSCWAIHANNTVLCFTVQFYDTTRYKFTLTFMKKTIQVLLL